MPYDSVVLYYMTGTGNTARVAGWMAAEAEKSGAKTELRQIGRNTPPLEKDPGKSMLLGVLMPTHGFTAPWPVVRLAFSLPFGRGTHAFISPTRAGTKFGMLRLPGLEGTAGYLIALILRLKGYRIRGVQAFDMPANWIAVHPGFSDRTSREIGAFAEAKAGDFTRRILSGGRRFRGFIFLLLGVLLLPISAGYFFIGRFFLAKLFFANGNCNKCGLCVKSCPHGGVKMPFSGRFKPYWTFSCESCMRCMGYCPKKAIEAGHSWAVALFFITMPASLVFLLDAVFPLTPWEDIIAGEWYGFLLLYIYTLASIVISYAVFYVLVNVPFLNAVFRYTTFTAIFRRYHEPDVKITDIAPRSPGE
jgi:Pyruvate/2-oxoacid:ferredoxin oxidoreductase delta subunit